MATEHRVKQGECISSIAAKYGFLSETIWDDAANADLKKKRGDPNILAPGDVVVIPDIRLSEESGGAEKRHTFRRPNANTILSLRLLSDGEPVAETPYELMVENDVREGNTDSDGCLEEMIPALVTRVCLTLDGEETLQMELGALDPITVVSGIQARLYNLGLYCGKIDGQVGEETAAAIREFQRKNELQESGETDSQTQDRLQELHGC